MKKNFVLDSLEISVYRYEECIQLDVVSDYSQSSRKSQLFVNENHFTQELEYLWKSIKTKKLLMANISFGEIDWYTDETDHYEVPSFLIKRGLKRAKVHSHTHWSIPKDWSFQMTFQFADMKASTPMVEVLEKTLGSKFTPKLKKEFLKAIKPLLQGKARSANCYSEEEEPQRSFNPRWY